MSGIDTTTGNWQDNNYDKTVDMGSNNWGLAYQSGAKMNDEIKRIGDELNTIITDKNQSLDDPRLLAKISALNGHYNGARQTQSALMKALKDTAQAIIRNI
ncbi:EscF/YscF/HrpA family type III secretion system needle major subunit [Enterobacter ludwigii]|jgi:type III secretion protein F